MKFRGFTLIELIVVMGILAILATIVVIAVNPGRQFAASRNAKRASDTRAIANAIQQHAADNNGTTYGSITAIPQTIGTSGLNLSSILVPNYISEIPKDPSGGTDADTKYQVYIDGSTRVVVKAVSPELSKPIDSSGSSNYALLFDGSNDGIEIADHATLNPTSITISAWVRTTGTQPVNCGSVATKQSTAFADGYSLRICSDNTPNFTFRDTAPTLRSLSGSALSQGVWYHIVGTYNSTGGVHALYVNGAQVATGSYTVTIDHTNTGLGIGKGDVPGVALAASYFNGVIDDVRIYNRAISSSEVTQLYNGTNVSSGLAGLWNFDAGLGTTAADSSGNSNTGTLNGPTWVVGR